MPANKLFTTEEIELVLRLYREMKLGKKLTITESEQNFLRRNVVNEHIQIHYNSTIPLICYRGLAIVSNEPFYLTKERVEGDFDLEFELRGELDALKAVQSADQVRMLVYDGKPIEVLLQMAMLEMSFKLDLLPTSTSHRYGPSLLLDLARSLEENGTVNL